MFAKQKGGRGNDARVLPRFSRIAFELIANYRTDPAAMRHTRETKL
jgi:hypothetical protein